MYIDQKWKTYALCFILSDWNDDIAAPVLFDFLTDTDSDSLADLFDEHGIIVWEPFENWPFADIVELIESMARQAHITGNTP